ncbi:hypothetical protein THIOSC15_1400007 [uncultured Thiomicrorhabdus sp.]
MKKIYDEETGITVSQGITADNSKSIVINAPFDIDLDTTMMVIFSMLHAGYYSDRFKVEK